MREYKRKYYKKNREWYNQYFKRWRKSHMEERREYMRKYMRKHKKEVFKMSSYNQLAIWLARNYPKVWGDILLPINEVGFLGQIRGKMLTKPDLSKPAFIFLSDSRKAVEENRCPTCRQDIKEEDFRNELSKREYNISGMCQRCQDKVFGRN